MAESIARRRSIVVEVAIKVAGATALTTALLFAAIFLELRHATRDLQQAAIDTDLAGLVDAHAAEGNAGLVQRIGERLAFAPSSGDQPYYRLDDGHGHLLAGNLPQWPAAARAEVSEAGITAMPGGGSLQYRATLLRGGTRLLAGRATREIDRYLGLIGALFAAALVAMVVVAYVIGRLAARRLNHRLGAINRVFGDYGREGVVARAPLTRRYDEIDRLSANLNTVLDRIDRLLLARRELSDTIAHEIRSPLMQIGARIASARKCALSAEPDKALDQAQHDIRALQRMLDTLLDIAASEAQRGEMNSLGEIDLSEIALRLAELYEPAAEARGISFTAEVADVVRMRGEPVQISSLLVNLLDNAFKYGAKGEDGASGAIRLILRPGPEIIVEDEGTGVDPALSGRIFERFKRAHGGGQGHGLGLALARAIAERHGLTLICEDVHHDKANRGARFVVR